VGQILRQDPNSVQNAEPNKNEKVNPNPVNNSNLFHKLLSFQYPVSIVTNRQNIIPFILTTVLVLTISGSLFIAAKGQATNSTAESHGASGNSTSITDNLSINPPIIAHNSFYVIQSDTMLPALHKGDIIGVENRTSFNDLKIGYIIAYKSPGVREDTGQPEIIVHRIKQIYATPEGERVLGTKGDANPHSINLIDYPVTPDKYGLNLI
jgi:signal peptidase I